LAFTGLTNSLGAPSKCGSTDTVRSNLLSLVKQSRDRAEEQWNRTETTQESKIIPPSIQI